jgi:hypothetical protein
VHKAWRIADAIEVASGGGEMATTATVNATPMSARRPT